MRTVFRSTVSLLVLLPLMACAPAKPVAPVTGNPPPTPLVSAPAAEMGPGAGFVGLWYVSGVFPAAMAQASPGDPHLGAALVIDTAEVSDVNGQRCVTPAFQTDKTEAQSIGLKAATGSDWDRLVVRCNDKAFATYVLIPAQHEMSGASGAALLQQRPEALYLLERADRILHRLPSELADTDSAGAAQPEQTAHAVPVVKEHAKKAKTTEVSPAAAAPTPVPEGPVAMQADAAPQPTAKASAPKVSATGGAELPAPGTAMHLASYKGESAAKRGWKILLGDYDELDPLSPLYLAVDVPGKGAIIRLYATGADKAELTKICAALTAKKVYCTLNP